MEYRAGAQEEQGRVWLVGAGPGDPELLTVKATCLIGHADAVVYDRLVGPEILELIGPDAHRVEVGKTAGGPSWKQEDINVLLIELARGGANVVRLKSGDPGIFGRADEEIAALMEAGIDYGIVPGITSAAAAAASAGISLTRRGRNRSVTLLTAHDSKGFAEQDWSSLTSPDSACAIYMGVRAARFVQGRLLLHGASHDTPVTIVENASRDNEIVVSGTLARLPEIIRANGITGPAVIFIGLAPHQAHSAVPATAAELGLLAEANR